MRLALALGRTLDELDRSMTAEELRAWIAFDAVEPIGERRGDLRLGILTALTANVHRDPKAPPFRPLDFIPWDPSHADEAVRRERARDAEFQARARVFLDAYRARMAAREGS